MVNNEFPFSDRGEPMADKQFTFRCSPSYVRALNEMGVDIVSLANNHTLDYGRAALSDTFSALDGAGILYGGAGDSVERAKEVQIMEVNGKNMDLSLYRAWYRLLIGRSRVLRRECLPVMMPQH